MCGETLMFDDTYIDESRRQISVVATIHEIEVLEENVISNVTLNIGAIAFEVHRIGGHRAHEGASVQEVGANESRQQLFLEVSAHRAAVTDKVLPQNYFW